MQLKKLIERTLTRPDFIVSKSSKSRKSPEVTAVISFRVHQIFPPGEQILAPSGTFPGTFPLEVNLERSNVANISIWRKNKKVLAQNHSTRLAN